MVYLINDVVCNSNNSNFKILSNSNFPIDEIYNSYHFYCKQINIRWDINYL